jgi:hypothetical protein
MANIKISDLTSASAAADANEFEINESGTSKKVTGSQIKAYVNAGDGALAAKDTVATADIDNLAVTNGKLAADAVDGTKIADDAIDSEHIAADSIDAEHYAANSVDATALNVTGNGTSGQYLASDADGSMTWTDLPAGGGFSNMQVFNNPGTWTNPGDVEKVKVRLIGGGAGSGTGANGDTWKYGAPAGGYAEEVISIPSATNVAVTVGAAGNGANYANPGSAARPGNPGGTSSFGSYVSATGGTANQAGTTNLGGIGSGGQINARGQSGQRIQGSDGAGSAFGAGGRINSPGQAYGSGGGPRPQGFPNGGFAGSKGVVIVEY